MNMERAERILQTIDRLGAVSVKQLHEIMHLGSYRNTCRVVNQLGDYLHQARTRQKVVYLNKAGRELIGSTREVKAGPLLEHTLLANQAYIYFGYPVDWKREYAVEVEHSGGYDFGIKISGMTATIKKRIVADAVFNRNGYVHFVEIDNTRAMRDNQRKIEKYREIIRAKKMTNAKIYFFTTTAHRKEKLQKWLDGLNAQVLTFAEIR
ncbi:hypothetical protein [Heyndrickxia faecalis]|uniref:hypothetical protein n=1 Tax=Heyndrickxia faecalis TaxID=2824910 RepID=UPI003D1B7B38